MLNYSFDKKSHLNRGKRVANQENCVNIYIYIYIYVYIYIYIEREREREKILSRNPNV